MDQQKHSPHKDKHVKWDEQKLKQTEQYRGTYQKITEPKTPYRGNSDEQPEDPAEEPKTEEELQVEQSLLQAQKNREANKRAKVDLAALNAQLKEEIAHMREEEGEPMEEEEETEAQRKKKEEFKKKRAQHYNEFKRIQEAKLSNWEEDDD